MKGVDVNHPEKGDAKTQSVLAVVGSTDGMLGQYASHVSFCKDREQPAEDLKTSILAIIRAFTLRNGRPPKRILIYRDGVAENQFSNILEKEVPAFHSAFSELGYDGNMVKIAIVVCQKRHHSRFVYEEGAGGKSGIQKNEDPDYLNPCVGLCVDARSTGGDGDTFDDPDAIGSIVSPNCNEFYLSSHAAILGTSKMCKYTLVYDEIGLEVNPFIFKMFTSTSSLHS